MTGAFSQMFHYVFDLFGGRFSEWNLTHHNSLRWMIIKRALTSQNSEHLNLAADTRYFDYITKSIERRGQIEILDELIQHSSSAETRNWCVLRKTGLIRGQAYLEKTWKASYDH